MDLHTSENFWPIKNGLIQDFPSLKKSINTDVVIIGAGISGALVADQLCKEGFEVVILDKRHSGLGSTAASTALLQYEIDTPLFKLIDKVGDDHAVRSYGLCLKAIDDLEKLSSKFPLKSDFKRKPSFQFTSFKYQLKDHKKELELRQKFKISKATWLEPKEIKEYFGFTKLGGILSRDGAEVDPFKLAHNLIKSHWKKNLSLYDNTEVVNIEHKRDGVVLKTNTGHQVKAKKLVIACGYESQKYLSKNVEIQKSTYAIVSEVIEEKKLWHKNALIWETADPYIYLRTTADNRILIGGKDDDFYNPQKRDLNLPVKARALEKEFKKLFPKIPFRTDYKWAGTFCGTKDGLPYIGGIPERPHTYFALGFGGNGITFSMIAAQIIRDLVSGRKNDDQKMFSFQR
jgi:glycine/D-amino acid oxidase-like deaminating enzyme